MKHKLLNKNLLALAITAVLATGCGGGGSSTPAADNASIGGSASKGIIKAGIIKVFKMTSTGAKDGDAIAETVTDATGAYSLTGLPSTGTAPVLIELSVGSDTKMVCDALSGCGTVARGNDLDPPTGFTLRAVLPPIEAGATLNTQLTAFTDMAASRALSSGTVTTAGINAANSEISAIAGVNIREVQPADITNLDSNASTREQQYALMNAAIADLVFENDGDLTRLAGFSDDFEDGVLGNATAGGLDPQTLIDRVNAEANDTSNNSGLSETVRQQATSLADVLEDLIDDQAGTLDPAPSSIENLTEVAQAKALVTETRNWVNSFSNLESPAEAFSTETDALTEILDENTEAVVEVLANVLDQVGKAVNENTTFPLTVTILNGQTQIGTATLTNSSSSSSTSLTISALNVSGVDIIGSITLNRAANTEVIPAGTTTLTMNGYAKNDNVKVTLNETSFSLGLASALDTNSSSEPNINTVQLTGGVEIATVNNGEVTENSIAGNAEIKLAKLTDTADTGLKSLGLKRIAFTDLIIANSAGSSTLDVSLDFNDATSLDNYVSADGGVNLSTSSIFTGILGISGTINLSQRPAASASLVLNRVGEENGAVTLTIGHDGRSVVLNFSGNNEGTATLTASNSDGVSMTLTGTANGIDGTVTINDKAVGSIEESNGIVIIRYNDGSFESLGGSADSGSESNSNTTR